MGAPYSSIDAAIADYQTYQTYEYTGGVSAAQSFLAAALYLLLVRPDESGNQGANVKLNNAALQGEVDRARIYINRMNLVGGGVKIHGVDSAFRGHGVPNQDDPLIFPT